MSIFNIFKASPPESDPYATYEAEAVAGLSESSNNSKVESPAPSWFNPSGKVSQAVENAGKRILDDAVSRAKQNKPEVVAYLKEVLNEALFSSPPDKLLLAKDSVSQFLRSPNDKTKTHLQNQLNHISKDLPPNHVLRGKIVQVLDILSTEAQSLHDPNGENLTDLLQTIEQGLQTWITSQTGTAVVLKQLASDIEKDTVRDLKQLPGEMLSSLSHQFLNSSRRIRHEQEEAPLSGGEEKKEGAGFESFLANGQHLLSLLSSKAGDELSRQAAHRMAQGMLFAFGMIQDHINKNPAQVENKQKTLDEINRLSTQVEEAQRSPTIQPLLGCLTDSLKLLREQQVYFQGFRLPLNEVKPSSSAMPDIQAMRAKHREVLHKPNAPRNKSVSSQDVYEQRDRLVIRASIYGVTQFVNEHILKVKNDLTFYAGLIEVSPGNNLDQFPLLVQQKYFQWIDEQKALSFFSKRLAKIAYRVGIRSSSFIMNSMISNVIKSFENWQKAPDELGNKEIQIIEFATNCAAKLNGCYDEAATQPDIATKALAKMLLEAIQRKERNGGLESKEVYDAFAEALIEVYGPKFRWRDSITHLFTCKIPCTSCLHRFSPLFSWCATVISKVINTLILIPEWIANTLLQKGMQFYLKRNHLIESGLKGLITSLTTQDSATRQALDSILYNQLERVKRSMNEGQSQDRQASSEFTEKKKQQIESLTAEVFEVLNKTSCRTRRELADQKGDSTASMIKKKLDDLILLPKANQAVSNIISHSFNTFKSAESQNQFFHDILLLFNNSLSELSEKKAYDIDDSKALDRGIRDLVDEIIEASMTMTLRNQFDFSGEPQKKDMEMFIHNLKTESIGTHTETSEAEGIVQRIKAGMPEIDFNAAEEGLVKLGNIIENSDVFLGQILTIQGNADANASFHTATKEELNRITKDLHTQYSPIADSLDKSYRTYEQTVYIKTCSGLWKTVEEQRQKIGTTLDTFTTGIDATPNGELNPIKTARDFADQIDPFLSQLKTTPHSSSLGDFKEFDDLILKLKEQLKDADAHFLHLQCLSQSIPDAFEEFKKQKLQVFHLPNPPKALAATQDKLHKLIQSLPDEIRTPLLNQSRSLMAAKDQVKIEEFSKNFNKLQTKSIQTIKEKLNLQLTETKPTQVMLSKKIENYQDKAGKLIAENKLALHEIRVDIDQSLNTFTHWVETIQPIPIWNLFAFDMQWLTDFIKDVTIARLKQKASGFMDALYQEHIYVGILHQMILLPFLEKHRPDSLRAPL